MTKAADHTSISVNLTDAEIIEMIRIQAAQDASVDAKERLNFFLGIVFAVIGLLSVAAGFVIEERIETRVEAEVETQVREAISAATLLPLLVAEANALSGQNTYREDSADRLISLLSQMRPDILALEADSRWLANRRIEDTIRAFWQAGDYTRVFRTSALFGDTLHGEDRVFGILARSMATGILIHPDFRDQHDETYRSLTEQSWQPRSSSFELQRLMIVIARASEAGFSADVLAQLIEQEGQRSEAFAPFMAQFLLNIEAELSPGERNHTPLSAERYDTLYSVFFET